MNAIDTIQLVTYYALMEKIITNRLTYDKIGWILYSEHIQLSSMSSCKFSSAGSSKSSLVLFCDILI